MFENDNFLAMAIVAASKLLSDACFHADEEWKQPWDASSLLVVELQGALLLLLLLLWCVPNFLWVLQDVLGGDPENVSWLLASALGSFDSSEKHGVVFGVVVFVDVGSAEKGFLMESFVVGLQQAIASLSLRTAHRTFHGCR